MGATFRKIVVLSIAMFALCGATVGAETTTLTAADHGILGAMRRMGCHNPLWLGRVMISSGILESQSKRLSPGTAISIPDACINGEAPTHADILVTQHVFAAWALLERAQAMANASAATPPANPANTGSSDKGIIDSLMSANRRLNALLVADEQALENSVGRRTAIIFSIITLLIGIAFGLSGAWTLINRRAERKAKEDPFSSASRRIRFDGKIVASADLSKEEYPTSVEFHGRTIPFTDTTPSPTLGCPFCKAEKIKPAEESMRQHLAEAHPELRVVERELPPELEPCLIRVS